MNLLGFGTVIVHFLIISHSYRLICKGQIKAKELYVFGAYTLLVEAVLELTFYFLSLDGLGIVTFLFPLGLYSYFRWIKQYERDRGLFLSLLLSLLYESAHNFLSVTFSSITGDNFCFTILLPILFRCNGVDLFCCLKNHSLFPLRTNLF